VLRGVGWRRRVSRFEDVGPWGEGLEDALVDEDGSERRVVVDEEALVKGLDLGGEDGGWREGSGGGKGRWEVGMRVVSIGVHTQTKSTQRVDEGTSEGDLVVICGVGRVEDVVRHVDVEGNAI
jgi:hypothetical protein